MKLNQKLYISSLLFLFIICLFSKNGFSKNYLVEKPDGSVAVIQYVEGSNDSLMDVIHANGFDGYPIEELNVTDIPQTREDRKYWKKGLVSKIEIDQDKKDADLLKTQQDLAEKAAVLEKLKITEDEAKALTSVADSK